MNKKEIKEEKVEKKSGKDLNEGHALETKIQTAEGWRRTHEKKGSSSKKS